MDERLTHLWQTERAAGFSGLAGVRVATTIPISDALLNEAIAAYLPVGGRIQELTVRAHPADRVTVRVTLAKPAFLPPVSLKASVERQPEFPDSPVLVLRLEGAAGLMKLAGPAMALMNARLPGIRIEGDRVLVDLRVILREHGREAWLDHVDRAEVTTDEGHVILFVAAALRG